MKVADFSFHLPEELIAFFPKKQRSSSRLLQVDGVSGVCVHSVFNEILDWLKPQDLLVFNNTKVIPARLYGHKATGGKIELLIERLLGEQKVLAHAKTSNALKSGQIVQLPQGYQLVYLERRDGLFEFKFLSQTPVLQILDAIGHMPLPPYIQRTDETFDQERYQTVYAQKAGAVAAPTAGLHFDQPLLDAIAAKGVQTAFVTLHVGAGTFQPVRVEHVNEHRMHSEYFEVNQDVIAQVQQTKVHGGRVIAVGTTSVRALESAFTHQTADIASRDIVGETNIFIYPGYEFQVVDAMITNFHLPESTLLMLVSAFAGYKHIMSAYTQAIAHKYRFFSYGDAMLLTRPNGKTAQEKRQEIPSYGCFHEICS